MRTEYRSENIKRTLHLGTRKRRWESNMKICLEKWGVEVWTG